MRKGLRLWICFDEKLGFCISFYLRNRDDKLKSIIRSLGYRFIKEDSKLDSGFWYTIKIKHLKFKKAPFVKKIEKIANDIINALVVMIK